VESAVSWQRRLAAGFVLAAFTLAALACAFVAFFLLVMTFLFNGGAPRVGWLAATLLMLIVTFGVAFGGHVLADRIAPSPDTHERHLP
jgi:hypothetical protein